MERTLEKHIYIYIMLLLFSCWVVSNSLWPHGLQHARLLCLPLSPGVCSNSCTLSQWWYITISSSVAPLLLPSIFPSIRVFSNELALYIRWPKYWSFSFSVSPSKGYPGLISFRMDWFDSLLLKELSRIFSSTTVRKHQFFGMHSAFFMAQLSHLYMTTWKIIALIIWIFVSKVKPLLFNMLSRFVKVFLPKSNFMVAVTVCSDI